MLPLYLIHFFKTKKKSDYLLGKIMFFIKGNCNKGKLGDLASL